MPDLTAVEKFDRITKLMKSDRPGEETDPPGERGIDTDDEKTGDNFLGGPNPNPFYEVLRRLALSASKEKEHLKKTPDQVIDHLIRHNPVAGKLAAAASAHGLKQNATA